MPPSCSAPSLAPALRIKPYTLGGKEGIAVNISRRFFTLLMTLGLISPIDCHTASTREKNMTVDKERIRQLLERLGKALSAGDSKGVSTCWQIPALIFLDEAGTAVGDTSEIEKLFAEASESYKK